MNQNLKTFTLALCLAPLTSHVFATSYTTASGKQVPDLMALPPVVANPENMPTPERMALGQALFFDNRISGSGTINCATCHVPDQGWTVQAPLSPAHPGYIERRNSPC